MKDHLNAEFDKGWAAGYKHATEQTEGILTAMATRVQRLKDELENVHQGKFRGD